MAIDHCVPVTATVVPTVPACVPFPVVAPLMTNRCANAALLDLTRTVQLPCIEMIIGPPAVPHDKQRQRTLQQRAVRPSFASFDCGRYVSGRFFIEINVSRDSTEHTWQSGLADPGSRIPNPGLRQDLLGVFAE